MMKSEKVMCISFLENILRKCRRGKTIWWGCVRKGGNVWNRWLATAVLFLCECRTAVCSFWIQVRVLLLVVVYYFKRNNSIFPKCQVIYSFRTFSSFLHSILACRVIKTPHDALRQRREMNPPIRRETGSGIEVMIGCSGWLSAFNGPLRPSVTAARAEQ